MSPGPASVVAGIVDAALEASVVGSFSRIGYDVRGRLGRWAGSDAGAAPLDGDVVLVTGATSGIGLAAACGLARRGATVHLLARDDDRARRAVDMVAGVSGRRDVAYSIADLSDLPALRRAATEVSGRYGRLGGIVHAGGALTHDYRRAPGGTELTVTVHVLAPYLLTGLLLPMLTAGPDPARVVTVSSGGMYTQGFSLDRLESGPGAYTGSMAYARAKRAQVVLNHEWVRRTDGRRITHHAMHPGWADTPGIAGALPTFHRVLGPLLRTPAQGADTAVWLVSAPEGGETTGGFWLDRHRRLEHHLPWTLGGSPPSALWDWCAARTGWDIPARPDIPAGGPPGTRV